MYNEHRAHREAYKVARCIKHFRNVWHSFNGPMMHKIGTLRECFKVRAQYTDKD